MNENKNNVNDYVNGFFKGIDMTNDLYVLQRTITKNINEKLWSNLDKGHSYEKAFDLAIHDSSNIENLINKQKEISKLTNKLSKTNNGNGFLSKKRNGDAKPIEEKRSKRGFFSLELSIIVFLLLGFVFDAWSWAWIIIVIPFLKLFISNKILVPLIIYLHLGFLFNGWAWGWVIIPVSIIYYSDIGDKLKLISLTPFVIFMICFYLSFI